MQEHKYPIKHWSKDDRPREKLLSSGAEGLSNSELLALLIHNGTKEQSAVDLAREVLKLGKHNLVELGKLSAKELMRIKGIGEVKAITIVAALELGRRRQLAEPISKDMVRSGADIARYLQIKLKDLRREVFSVIFMNQSNRINSFEVISEGGITSTVADPRIILKRALEEDAVKIVLCHNHPSGNIKPSKADEELTKKIKSAAGLMDIQVVDHVIVSDSGYFSFADEGLL